jgi:hypothetical protein
VINIRQENITRHFRRNFYVEAEFCFAMLLPLFLLIHGIYVPKSKSFLFVDCWQKDIAAKVFPGKGFKVICVFLTESLSSNINTLLKTISSKTTRSVSPEAAMIHEMYPAPGNRGVSIVAKRKRKRK